jgi:hypothetical protein
MRMRKKALLAITALALFAAVGPADALRLRAGNLLIIGDGGFTPRALPKHRDAPIVLYGGGRITTVSGALPPILKTLVFEFDRHGSVQTAGLPFCTAAKLQATTVPVARKACPGSIVGKGFGKAIIAFPDQVPFPIRSPITLFNGPKKRGNDTVLAHAYTTVPTPTTFIVPVEIEKIRRGVYGYRTEARIPVIAGGYGIPVAGALRIGRRWTYRGVRRSYVNARCATGHLQAWGDFAFNDGTRLSGTFVRACTVRR